MKSIERRFNIMKEKYPNVGDYSNFCLAVKNQGFSRKAISLDLSKLIDIGELLDEENEYDNGTRKMLLDELEKSSNPLYDGDFEAKFPSDWTIGLKETLPIISSTK